MISTTFNWANVLLLNDPPNWSHGFKSSHHSVTDKQDGLTKHSARRPYSATLLTDLKFSVTVSGSAATALVGALRGIGAQQVLCPFWPAVSFWSSRAGAAIKGGTMVAFKRDWSQWTVYAAGSEPVWPGASDLVAPVLLGTIAPDSA